MPPPSPNQRLLKRQRDAAFSNVGAPERKKNRADDSATKKEENQQPDTTPVPDKQFIGVIHKLGQATRADVIQKTNLSYSDYQVAKQLAELQSAGKIQIGGYRDSPGRGQQPALFVPAGQKPKKARFPMGQRERIEERLKCMGQQTAADMIKATGIAQAEVHKHIRELRAAGKVEVCGYRGRGKKQSMVFRIVMPGKTPCDARKPEPSQEALEIIRTRGNATAAEISDQMTLGVRVVYQYIRDLTAEGRIKIADYRDRGTKKRAALYEPTDDNPSDSDHLPEICPGKDKVIEAITTHGPLTVVELSAKLKLGRRTTQKLVKSLEEAGRLESLPNTNPRGNRVFRVVPTVRKATIIPAFLTPSSPANAALPSRQATYPVCKFFDHAVCKSEATIRPATNCNQPKPMASTAGHFGLVFNNGTSTLLPQFPFPMNGMNLDFLTPKEPVNLPPKIAPWRPDPVLTPTTIPRHKPPPQCIPITSSGRIGTPLGNTGMFLQ